MAAVLSPLRVPLIALAVALGGVGLAWLWFNHHRPLAVIAVVAAVLVGWVIDRVGERLLPDHPKAALYLLEGWLLISLTLAMAAGAAVVIITVELTLPDSTPTSTMELVGAVSTGLTTFLTAGFISWAGDEKDSTLSDHVMKVFQRHYTRPGKPASRAHTFKPESNGELWVFAEAHGGAEGWGGSACRKRAKGIAAELGSGDSDP
jgi:hypothetical protein